MVYLKRWGLDCLRWRMKRNDMFDVCSYYETLRGSTGVAFPLSVRCTKFPKRGAFLVLVAIWGKILTHDNLGEA